MTGLRQTARVVGDGAERVDGDRCAYKGQHSQRGQRNAISSADFAREEQRHADDQNGQQAGAGTDGVALGDHEGLALGGDLGQFLGGIIVGRGIVFRDGADSNAAQNAQHGRKPRAQPAQTEVGVQLHLAEHKQRGEKAHHNGNAGGDPRRQIQFLGGIIAHLAEGRITKAQYAAQQTAARQHDGIDTSRVKGGLAHSALRAVEQGNGDHDGRGHGSHKAFQQVGAVARDIVHVVADEVRHHVGHATVVLGHVVAQLGQNVGGNIRGLGVVAARHAVEHGHQRAAQRIRRDPHDRGVAGQVGQQTPTRGGRVDALPDDQHQHQTQHSEGLHTQAGNAAAAQRHLHGLTDGQSLPGAVGGAHVGIGSAAHSQHAHSGGHTGADQEGNTAGFFNEQAEHQRHQQNHDGDRAVFGF